jgi:methionyl-tRNA formyltransferase
MEIQEKARVLKVWRAEVEKAHGVPGSIARKNNAGLVVACGEDALRLLEVQPEGRRRMAIGEFLAGHAVSRVLQDQA